MYPRISALSSAIAFAGTLLTASACGDSTQDIPSVTQPTTTIDDTVRVSTSVRWNQRAVALVVARQPASNGQAAVSRILTYLSLAQFRAMNAALAAAGTSKPPSVTAAIGGASTVVLNAFFPLDVASTEATLNSDLSIPPWPSGAKEDVAAGEALGRGIGAAVNALAATDNYLLVAPGSVPAGPDKWQSSTAAVVRSLHGTKPFFLASPSQLRAPAPPAPGSAQFAAALAEVKQIADTRTAAQVALAVNWNTSSGPFTAGALNLIADSVIREKRLPEKEATRILAYANAAAFDAQIACWDSKFAYWAIRPSQADPSISMAIALPNHPSYPSGHSCMTGAFMGILSDALRQDQARFDALVDEAGMSRVYGGIHFRFDIDAGRDIGRAAAALALKTTLK